MSQLAEPVQGNDLYLVGILNVSTDNSGGTLLVNIHTSQYL